MPSMPTKFLDIEFNDQPLNIVAGDISAGCYEGSIIVTPNVDHIVRFHNDINFKSVYSKCDLFLNDSRILELLSKIANKRIENTVPGSDLTEYLFSNTLANSKLKVVCIGAKPMDILNISEKYKVDIVHIEPSYGFIRNKDEVSAITTKCLSFDKALFFIAVGSPQQEELAIHLKNAGVPGTFLCIGASLLFLSGTEKRAPIGWRKLRLEWFYRFILSPRRLFKRYFINGPKIFMIFIKSLSK